MQTILLLGLVAWSGLLLGACRDIALPGAGPEQIRLADDAGMRFETLREAAAYAGGSGVVLRGGREVIRWGDTEALHDLKSTTKSIAVLALGLALDDGRLALSDPVVRHLPGFGVPPEANRRDGWLESITVFQLATHTGGFDFDGGYEALLFRPGTAWAYSDCGTNWLADALTLVYRRDLDGLLFERVLDPMGISRKEAVWRDHWYREPLLDGIPRREIGSGMHASVQAMARIGELMRRKGDWGGRQLVGRAFVEAATGGWPDLENLPVTNDPEGQYAGAPTRYGLLWWHNGDRSMPGVPSDAFWSWGLHESTIAVIPSLGLVIARAGDSPTRRHGLESRLFLERFFALVAAAAETPLPVPGAAPPAAEKGSS